MHTLMLKSKNALFNALVLFILFSVISCSSPKRESQWMNIPRDSTAIGKHTKLDTLDQPMPDTIIKNDSIVEN